MINAEDGVCIQQQVRSSATWPSQTAGDHSHACRPLFSVKPKSENRGDRPPRSSSTACLDGDRAPFTIVPTRGDLGDHMRRRLGQRFRRRHIWNQALKRDEPIQHRKRCRILVADLSIIKPPNHARWSAPPYESQRQIFEEIGSGPSQLNLTHIRVQ